MSQPMYLSGDSVAIYDSGEYVRAVYCGECDYEQEIGVDIEWHHGYGVYVVDYICPNCGERNNRDIFEEDN